MLAHKWENTWTFRAGVLYKLPTGCGSPAGFVYDQTPQPDADVGAVPAGLEPRRRVSIGGGFQIAKTFEFQLSSLFLWFHERTITTNKDNFNGTYKTFAILPGVGFKMTF